MTVTITTNTYESNQDILASEMVINPASGDQIVYIGADTSNTYQLGAWRDVVQALGGDDYISTADNNDSVEAGYGNDTVIAGNGDDGMWGNQGNDSLDGGTGSDVIYGGQDNDTIMGGDGLDYLLGNLGNDVIYGNQGNDPIYGGQGNDTIYGGKGLDLIVGNKGNDVLSGGADADVFLFNPGDGQDTITDFTTSAQVGFLYSDKISISANVISDPQALLNSIHYSNGNAYIDLGHGDTITVLNIAAGGLSLYDFYVTS